MILKAGSFEHDQDELHVVIRIQVVTNARGYRYLERHVWNINGILYSDTGTPSSLTTKINNLKAAYASNGIDVILYENDGTTQTAYALVNSQTIGGVIVRNLSFPQDGLGAVYVNRIPYRLTISADYPVSGTPNLLHYKETLRFTGGGPQFVYIQTLTGNPQRQQVAQNSSYTVVQQGMSLGFLDYAGVATPLVPEAVHTKRSHTHFESPREDAGFFTHFKASWRYEMESHSAINGTPGTGV